MTSGSFFWTVLSAAIGGLIVFFGLVLEQLAEKSWYASVRASKFWKSTKVAGEWLVLIGVGIEVMVAAVTAANEWGSDPLKKPIASASASASIVFLMAEKGISPNVFFDASPDTLAPWGAWIRFSSGKDGLLILSAAQPDCAIWAMGSDIKREVRI